MEKHFYLSKIKMVGVFILMILLTLAVAVMMVSMVVSEEGIPIVTFLFLGLIFLLFAWCTYFIGKKLFSDEPNVTVSPKGITLYGTQNPGFIEWDDIDGFFPYLYQRNRLLGVILKDEEKYIDNLSSTGKRLARMNQKMGFPSFNISMNLLKEEKAFLEALAENEAPFFIEGDSESM
ncbi:STM3941 family protein [Bacillus sp. 31A1R]|uniref:STM3941 family protein n=1 Tax=Robertmurraya mangrovi TaxID=3098077 RepID=A0ABU5J4Z6_9BACI|nr:STM3941 family protein [Bacillus sp. 31A1R]MDZ5474412.1 STM3941 family protein [Bacillus sp. 31A1R]